MGVLFYDCLCVLPLEVLNKDASNMGAGIDQPVKEPQDKIDPLGLISLFFFFSTADIINESSNPQSRW